MKNILKLIVAPMMLIVVSCDNNPISSSEQLSDNQIIELIQSSEKIEISFDELPSKSQSNIQSEHIDYESFKNWKASGYGYFVELSGRGQSAGNLREVYFDENGRSLGHSNSDDRDRTDGDEGHDEEGDDEEGDEEGHDEEGDEEGHDEEGDEEGHDEEGDEEGHDEEGDDEGHDEEGDE